MADQAACACMQELRYASAYRTRVFGFLAHLSTKAYCYRRTLSLDSILLKLVDMMANTTATVLPVNIQLVYQ